jgi:serine protease
MSRTSCRAAVRTLAAALVASLALAAAAPVFAKTAKTMPTLRVMLNPVTAPRGSLPDSARTRIESLAGAPVTVAAVTRTGALDLAIGGPRDRAALQALAGKLRTERSVLWVEVTEAQTVRPKSAIAAKAAQQSARKLLVRFDDGVDSASVVGRLSALAGAHATIERSIGAVHVIALAWTLPMYELEAIARKFETDPGVRYADPVRRVTAYRVPNDPLYSQQWALENMSASTAWDAGTGSSSVTVAVVDTGMLDHPDLAGRVLPGHDFIVDVDSARDGDARDGNPRDEGDWTDDGDCSGFGAQPSFFHGLFIAGQIAANANNDLGIAGLDWAAKILPVRVLGKCGGTFDDIAAGIAWSAGFSVDGAPTNPHPARVINLSLGGFGSCPAAVQEVIDDALAQGTVVVAAAGNESDDASFFSPANCSGVITVGALGRTGERSSYSNFGRRVDISAPGGDVDVDGQILSTHAAGDTVPGDFNYDVGIGTSFAAPLVSGTLSLMFARNPNLTVGQTLSLLQGSSSDFALHTSCAFGGFCGIGMLNAGGAMASTIPAITNLPPGAVAVVEYYDAALDHYLITSDPVEIQNLDTFGGARWQRTGHVFYAWADPAAAPAGVFPRGVCRFYAGPEQLIDSFFYTADAGECSFVTSNPVWSLQTSAAFWVEVPDAAGSCREGTLPVYRFFNGRRDANQRHTIDLSVRRAMLNRVWVPDGKGANGAAMCSLI